MALEPLDPQLDEHNDAALERKRQADFVVAYRKNLERAGLSESVVAKLTRSSTEG